MTGEEIKKKARIGASNFLWRLANQVPNICILQIKREQEGNTIYIRKWSGRPVVGGTLYSYAFDLGLNLTNYK